MDRLYGYNQRMPSNGYFWVTIFPVVALAGALRAAWSPLIDLPYNGAWDAFCYYWDDGANFVELLDRESGRTHAGLAHCWNLKRCSR